jgi:hypothetical protein
MAKTTYLVIARMAGNFAMIGETKDKTETIDQVIERAARPRGDANGKSATVEVQLQAPTCPVHDRPMVLMHGRRGPFWSCHQKSEDGTWCDYQPGEPI